MDVPFHFYEDGKTLDQVPLVSRVYPLAQASQALAAASSKDGIVKIQLDTMQD